MPSRGRRPAPLRLIGGLVLPALAVEWSLPVYQDLHGPQLETGWALLIGWQKSFG